MIIGILAIIEKLRPDHDKLADPSARRDRADSRAQRRKCHRADRALGAASDIPDIHVIVVDDGSADRTLELLNSNFCPKSGVQIIHQIESRQSGGVEQCAFACADGNRGDHRRGHGNRARRHSQFAAPLFRSQVGAVAGNVKVGNRSRWLTRWQALEYITSQNMEKRAFDLLNCITVVPGALGAWRRQAIEAAGGITADTVAEDADLTIAIRRLGWRVTYDEYADCLDGSSGNARCIDSPAISLDVWNIAIVLEAQQHTCFGAKYGTLGWVALPNIFVFQIVLPLISPIIDLLFLGSLLLWGLAQLHITQIPQLWTTADVQRSVYLLSGIPDH